MSHSAYIPAPHRSFGQTLIEAAEATGTALFTTVTPLPKDGSTPEWVTVFPKVGRVETRDGRAFDVEAKTLIEAFRADGIEIPIDVNHSTDAAGMFGGEAPAVGWGVDLRENDGGLQVRVEWLDQGKSLLAAKQYKYTSPSFFHDKTRATRLKALALVTSPALARQPALARTGQGSGLAGFGAFASALGLGEAASEAECLAAISSLREGSVPRQEHDSLVAQLAALQSSNRAGSIEKLIDDALKAGKITPAQKGQYEALCATDGGFAQVATLLANAPPHSWATPSGLDSRGAIPAGNGDETPIALAARATRYLEQQAASGVPVTMADAVLHASSHPNAGR